MTQIALHRLLLVLPLSAAAQDIPPPPQVDPDPLPADAPPPVPAGVEPGERLEPEVKIIKREDAVTYEYRLNNQLYMVRVVPRKGPPYYLMDTDGDGSLESRYTTLEPNLVVPNWMIYRW
jgi:hypothetical protein